jgi:type IV pilus assembly protein PilE
MNLPAAAPRSRGFTLIELMVVVVIACILLGIAVPSYMSQVRQSRRTEAKTAVLDMAGREERYMSTAVNGATYSQAAADLGYPALPARAIGSGYYDLFVCTPAAAGCAGTPAPPAGWVVPPAPNYLVIATPTAGTTQVNDTQCVAFFVDSVGKQMSVSNGGADTTATCWPQ